MKHSFELTLFIGLSAPSDTPGFFGIAGRWRARRRSRIAHRTLRLYFQSFTTFGARGTWRGQQEPSLVMQVILQGAPVDLARTAETVARRIGRNLGQDAVAFTLSFAQFHEVKVRRPR